MSVAHASEQVAVVDVIDPDNYGTGNQTGSWVSAKDFHKYLAVVYAGDLGTSATIDAKIQQATDSSGTSAKDVSNSSITQLTDGDSDSNQQALIELRPEDLDVAGGFDHIRIEFTVGTASSDAAMSLYGIDPRHGPASDQDATSVDEIVTAG